jgi:hypothetical protein
LLDTRWCNHTPERQLSFPAPQRPPHRWRKRLVRVGGIIACLIAFAVVIVCVFPDEMRRYVLQLVQRHFDRTIDRYITNLPAIDEVRIVHLEPIGTSPSFATYDVPLNDEGREMNIVAEKILKGVDALQFASLWRRQDLQSDSFAMCHVPHHAIQFRSKGSEVVDVAVCFMCQNISFSGFLPAIVGFEDDSPDYATLRSVMEQHVGAHEEKRNP